MAPWGPSGEAARGRECTGTKASGVPPKSSQNVEVPAMEQILISASPSPYRPTPTRFRGFVYWQERGIDLYLCPFHRVVLWLLPSPLYLTHWSSVLYFFFKMIVCFFVVFTSVVEKNKKQKQKQM